MTSMSHLDDARLSAVLDNEGEGADVQHAEVCPECRARLALWRDATRMVAVAPAVPDPAQRDAAVSAALAAVSSPGDAAPMAGEGANTLSGAGSIPVPLDGRRRRRASLVGTRVAAVAAAVLVIAGVSVALLDHGLMSTSSKSNVAGPVTSTLAPRASGGASGLRSSSATTAGSGASGGGVAGPDSGTIRPGPAASSAAPTLGSYENMTSLDETLRDDIANAQAGRATSASSPFASVSLFATCLARAAADAAMEGVPSPVFEGTLSYAHIASQVFVFAKGGNDVAVVLRASECGLVAQSTF